MKKVLKNNRGITLIAIVLIIIAILIGGRVILNLSIQKSATDAFEKSNQDLRRKSFNQQFLVYEENVYNKTITGDEARTIINGVNKQNSLNDKKVTLNGITNVKKEDILTKYSVNYSYDDDGYVKEIELQLQ